MPTDYMDPPKEEDTFEEVEAESILNRETGELPFAYFCPQSEYELTWICGYDAEGKITSVLTYKGPNGEERGVAYVEDKEKAEYMRDEFIKKGWQKLKPPKVTFTYPGQKEGKPLSRKERRRIQKHIKRLQKKNPFDKKQN